MRLLLQTIRGEFALFALSLALPLVALIADGRISAEVGEKHVVQ